MVDVWNQGEGVCRLSRLPRELLDIVLKHVDWTFSRAEAEVFRAELMEERTQFVDESNGTDGFFGHSFNMCEH
jgi:hypothetical protein